MNLLDYGANANSATDTEQACSKAEQHEEHSRKACEQEEDQKLMLSTIDIFTNPQLRCRLVRIKNKEESSPKKNCDNKKPGTISNRSWTDAMV